MHARRSAAACCRRSPGSGVSARFAGRGGCRRGQERTASRRGLVGVARAAAVTQSGREPAPGVSDSGCRGPAGKGNRPGVARRTCVESAWPVSLVGLERAPSQPRRPSLHAGRFQGCCGRTRLVRSRFESAARLLASFTRGVHCRTLAHLDETWPEEDESPWLLGCGPGPTRSAGHFRTLWFERMEIVDLTTQDWLPVEEYDIVGAAHAA